MRDEKDNCIESKLSLFSTILCPLHKSHRWKNEKRSKYKSPSLKLTKNNLLRYQLAKYKTDSIISLSKVSNTMCQISLSYSSSPLLSESQALRFFVQLFDASYITFYTHETAPLSR